MIKITGQQVQSIDVQLSEYQLLNHTIHFLMGRYKLYGRWLDNTGTKIMQQESGLRHGSISDEFVRDATEEDKRVLSAISFLQDLSLVLAKETHH